MNATVPAAVLPVVRKQVKKMRSQWILISSGKGVCSNCNRLDRTDPLAGFCRYCGAPMIDDAVSITLQRFRDALSNAHPAVALTLEDLREMDGQAVYVVDDEYPHLSGWRIVKFDELLDAPTLWGSDGDYYDTRKDYGSTWRAYSYPPE